MKTKITLTRLILVSGLILTTLAAVSNTAPTSTSVTKETERTIRSYFKFPQVLLPHYETRFIKINKVEVLFTTDKNGKVNFVMAKTGDQELKQEIEKQFSALYLDRVKQNVVHRVVLNFRTL